MDRVMEPRIWLIAGPTASGKSALALRLAKETGAEIINADALQLYEDLEVLSARPSSEEMAQVPHHLFGLADGADGWSVGRWLRAALSILRDLQERERPAVIVGGTGLYFQALTQGLAEIPPIPGSVRRAVQDRYDTEGEAVLRAGLALSDPSAAARIAPGDRMRLTRALEVLEATGRPITAWQADTRPALGPAQWRGLILEPEREALYARCDQRFARMMTQGAGEEVARLMRRNLDPDLPVMKAVGVRELSAWLEGRTTLAAAAELACRETRRYAKRQLTWLRNQSADWPRTPALDLETQFQALLR